MLRLLLISERFPLGRHLYPKAKGSRSGLWGHSSKLSGHLGVRKTLSLISHHDWWPSLPQDVKDFVIAGADWTGSKVLHKKTAGLLYQTHPGLTSPWILSLSYPPLTVQPSGSLWTVSLKLHILSPCQVCPLLLNWLPASSGISSTCTVCCCILFVIGGSSSHPSSGEQSVALCKSNWIFPINRCNM